MKGTAKTAAYVAAAILAVVSAFFFVRERSLALHQTSGSSQAARVAWLALFILSVLFLGCICAYDLTRFCRSKAQQWMLQAASPVEPVAELQEAERLRSSGEPLDAIRVLREYLQLHPYEVHVMSRIAEIYRYDLRNDLAAALEYEQLIQHKLPDEQWAWAALHLAKLYGRLNELEKSVALLERIDSDYGQTVAGRRARKALDQVRNPGAESEEDEQASEEGAA